MKGEGALTGLWVLLFGAFCSCFLPVTLGSDVPNNLIIGYCSDSTQVYDPIMLQCLQCPTNATQKDGICVCNPGFAFTVDATTGASSCEDCISKGQVVSSLLSANGTEYCVPCGGDTQLSCLADAIFSESELACTCSFNSVLVERVGELGLTGQMCAACPSSGCVSCSFPYRLDAASMSCTCVDGFTMVYDGSCVLTSEYDAMVTSSLESSTTLRPPNIDNTGVDGSEQNIVLAETYAVGAAVLCNRGNRTACQFLSNLCVMMNYKVTSKPCVLYETLKMSRSCLDELCERVEDLPWLYYTRNGADVLSAVATTLRVSSHTQLQFIVATYDIFGNWLGNEILLEQINECRLPNPTLAEFMISGVTRRVSCEVNWGWFLVANKTVFYEVYLRNPQNSSELIPVPLLIDYSNADYQPKTFHDAWIYPSGATSENVMPSSSYRRRFYAYDNIGGRSTSAAGSAPTYVTSLRRVSILLGALGRDLGQLSVPLIVLQYASKMTSTIVRANETNALLITLQEPLNSTTWGTNTLHSVFSSYFLSSTDRFDNGMKTTLIVMCVLCFFFAWIRTYGWMRRRQYMVIDFMTLLRFLIYLCNCTSNMFFFVVSLASWYMLMAYKNQGLLSRAIKDNYEYVNGMLYAAVVAKGVAVLYGVVEQCNADYFVVDWERSKGQLLRENKVVPVSMWRSTFIANELNELQNLRYWHPLFTMAVILLFLVGLDFMGFSMSVPRYSRYVGDNAISLNVLRVAADTFLWIAVAIVIFVLEFQVFYRWVVVHPLQAFVDLCSVSNISIMILMEPQWGCYIHGESIHAHADVSMEEFQHNLFLEAQGNLPVRGLGGQSKCQTFEVFISPYSRQYLYMCYMEMHLERQKSHGKKPRTMNPAQWHFFSLLLGLSRKPRVYSQAALTIKDRINYAFQQSVRRAESSLLMKFVLQKWLDFPPNVMYMNGPQRGDRSGKDLFFIDDVQSYGRAFMCGLDFDIFILYASLFTAIDLSLHNIYAAMVLTYAVEVVLRMYRRYEGLINLSQKTLIDDRFFI